MTLECYVCRTKVELAEHEAVLKLFDAVEERDDDPDENASLSDHMGLVHCMGPSYQFDNQTRVVVCRSCFDKGIEGCGLEHPEAT